MFGSKISFAKVSSACFRAIVKNHLTNNLAVHEYLRANAGGCE